MTRPKLERDALVRMRAAYLDLQSAKRYTEANDLLDLIERIEPPSPREDGEAVAVRLAGSSGRHGRRSASLPPVTSAPATYATTYPSKYTPCVHCGSTLAAHCTTHLLPCCPGSLMHGQDEGTWTPETAHR